MKRSIIAGTVLVFVLFAGFAQASVQKKNQRLIVQNDLMEKPGFKKKTKKSPPKTLKLNSVKRTQRVQTPVRVAQAEEFAPMSTADNAKLPVTPENTKSDVRLSTPPQGVTSVPVMAAQPEAKKSHFSFKYRSYNAMDLGAAEGYNQKPDLEVRAWDRFNFNYKFTANVSVGVMPQVYHTWFGDGGRPQDSGIKGLDQPYSAYMGNTGLIFADSNLANLKHDLNWDGFLRYDLPTSEFSQKAGEKGELWVATGLGKKWGAFEMKGSAILRYYFQQFNTSQLINAKTGLPLQNTAYRIYSLLDMSYSLSKKLTLSLETGFLNTVTYADPEHGQNQGLSDMIIMEPDINYAFNDNFNLSLGIWETPDMRKQTQGYVPLAAANVATGGDSEVYLMSTIQL